MKKYILSDLKRAFLSKKFLLSILGAAGIFFFFGDRPNEYYSIIKAYQFNIYLIHIVLVYFICTLPYGESLCEDLEKGFYRMLIIRGNVKAYVGARVISVFISSLFTMILGTLLYILIIKVQCPNAIWIGSDYVQGGAFEIFIEKEYYFLYIFFCSIQLGMLSGVLSLCSTLASLCIVNRLFTLSIPIISYYMLCYISQIFLGEYEIGRIYDPWYKLCEGQWQSFLITSFVTLILILFLAYGIGHQLKRRICDE